MNKIKEKFNKLLSKRLINKMVKNIDSQYKDNNKKQYYFSYYFGLPGCGKTTFAAYLAKKYQKQKKRVYSNVPIKGCMEVEKQDIGKYYIGNGLLIKDEAGVEDNNRNYKNMSEEEIKFYKYHRHFKLDIAVFSQSHDDVDVTLRRLSNRLYYLKKSMIPFLIKRREIIRTFAINKDTHQPEYQYKWMFFLFGTKYIFSPVLWKMFDTHSTYDLPKKSFKIFK